MSRPLTPAEAARHLLRLRDAQDSFLGFIRLIYPHWDIPPFHLLIIEALDRLEKGTLLSDFIATQSWQWGTHETPILATPQKVDNVLINMPPRHGKSTIATILYPAWVMARDARRFIMSCSYNADLAKDFGRQARELMDNKLLQQAFPEARIATDSRAADVWGTTAGGRYFGTGIGGTTAGRPANLLVLDDLIKARQEAERISERNAVWNYYTSSLVNRLQPEEDGQSPRIVACQTRWHPDDHAGRTIETDDWAEGRWLHINLPAITDADLPSASALWPERFNLDYLYRRRRLNARDFASLYQQQPYIEGGNIIKAQWWRKYDDTIIPERFSSVIIAVDSAFKTTTRSDYSVALVAGLTQAGDIFILEILRGKWEFPDLKQRLIALNARWRPRGLRAFYVEDKASGQSIIQELRRESGLSVIAHKVSIDKVSRVQSITPLIEGGRVFLPESSSWLDDFTTECQTFPGSTHDDQVDALSIALDALSYQTVSIESLDTLINAPSLLQEVGLANPTHSTTTGPTPTPIDPRDGGPSRRTPFGTTTAGTSAFQDSLASKLLGKTNWSTWRGWGS
jgi:predicted phage terminase large subunit-like protein